MIQYFNIDPSAIEEMALHPLGARRKNYNEVMWLQNGVSDFIIDADKYSALANSFFIFPKDRIHQFLPNSQVRGKVFRFTEDELDIFPKRLFSKLNHITEIKINKETIAQFSKLYETLEAEYAVSIKNKEVVKHILKAILFKLDAIGRSQLKIERKDADLIDQLELLFDERIKSEHSVKYYANALNMTTRKLTTIIKSVLNKSTNDLINERILIEAKKELVYSNNPISYIAFDLGFTDNSYFTKFFKKLSGRTPKQYRNLFKQ